MKSNWWRPRAESPSRRAHQEWDLVWQSRSGPPSQPWLEPDILDHLRALAENGVRDVVVSPLGFLSDHMEVMYDLDYEAAALAAISDSISCARKPPARTPPSSRCFAT